MRIFKKTTAGMLIVPAIVLFLSVSLAAAEIPPEAWLKLPLGMNTKLGYLPCPLSAKAKDWMTFGQFVDQIYKEEQEQTEYKAEFNWKPGEGPDIWVFTIKRIKARPEDAAEGIMVFKKLSTPNGNTIISIEQIVDHGEILPPVMLPDVWDDACRSHTGLGWKIYQK